MGVQTSVRNILALTAAAKSSNPAGASICGTSVSPTLEVIIADA